MSASECGVGGNPALNGSVGSDVAAVTAETSDAMRDIGWRVASICKGGDVVLLSGPLGSGKTTFAQGFARGLGVTGHVVSPTFTIAREMSGRFHDGSPAHLVHVDAYRMGGDGFAPGQDASGALLDELESLGLDEEIESPSGDTVVLMEWGEQMAVALAPVRLEVHIDRSAASQSPCVDAEASADGPRTVSIIAVGDSWARRVSRMHVEDGHGAVSDGADPAGVCADVAARDGSGVDEESGRAEKTAAEKTVRKTAGKTA